jgi:hypothetical protein
MGLKNPYTRSEALLQISGHATTRVSAEQPPSLTFVLPVEKNVRDSFHILNLPMPYQCWQVSSLRSLTCLVGQPKMSHARQAPKSPQEFL